MDQEDELLLSILYGCPHICQDDVDRLTELCHAGRSGRGGVAGHLVRSGLTSCDATDLAPARNGQRLQVGEFELRFDEGPGFSARLRDEFFQAAPPPKGLLSVWEEPIPALVFARALLRPDRLQAHVRTTAPAAEHVLSDTTRLARVPAVRGAPAPGGYMGPPKPGQLLGRCHLDQQIGKGGSSVVFLATHQKLHIRVAVKILHREAFETGEQSIDMIRREARLLAQLNHPNVVRVFDVEDEGEYPYIVLEYVEGLSLAQLLNQSGAVSADRVTRIATETVAGLAAAHRLGVIHRDVKPDNVLLTRDGQVKVADLGLGMFLDGRLEPKGQEATIVGTVSYISPEQARCDPDLDHRADIYSLGATLYHALVGAPPFVGSSASAILFQHSTAHPVPPAARRPGIPRALNDIVLRMLAKGPGDRFQTYDELTAALAPLAGPPGAPGLASAPTITGGSPLTDGTIVEPQKTSFLGRLMSGRRKGK
ncbi:serine/threonine-protein kinase [Frigoriglobus tundricola]|uniref:Serine/threonine protein kinase n=1 Tax=Frigoriglobus tundricola TaxID=2774151 RepID=A0A6M5YP83_9BACT|nr:serine/threonine-protein kinase [Frigoriglobus tundricola]QJW94782.1 Serine/threonine protein kinase [Frigoriglobus tundricola]